MKKLPSNMQIDKYLGVLKIDRLLLSNTLATKEDILDILDGREKSAVSRYMDYIEENFGGEIERRSGRYRYIKEAQIPKPSELFSDEYPEYAATTRDLRTIKNCLDLLSNFKDLPLSSELQLLVKKIENHIGILPDDEQNIIITEYNVRYRGFEHFDTIYRAIKEKKRLGLNYKPFLAPADAEKFSLSTGYNKKSGVFHWVVSPFFIKEYNNRWHLVGQCHSIVKRKRGQSEGNDGIINIAFDRILKSELRSEMAATCPSTLLNDQFDLIGFTRGPKIKVRIWFDAINLSYVVTKPLHISQEIIRKDDSGGEIEIEVEQNRELMQELIQYFPNFRIMEPESLRLEFLEMLQKMMDRNK